MGLFDQFADRIADRVLEDGVATRQQERAFRQKVLDDMRAYSACIERVRVALLQARDMLDLHETQPWLEQPRYRQLMQSLDDIRDEEHEFNMQYREFERLRFPQVRGQDNDTVVSVMRASVEYPIYLNAADRATELDNAWADLRPLLDEALDYEVVTYLRVYRHSTRRLVGNAVEVLRVAADRQGAARRPAVLVEECRQLIDQALEAADVWARHVLGARRQLGA